MVGVEREMVEIEEPEKKKTKNITLLSAITRKWLITGFYDIHLRGLRICYPLIPKIVQYNLEYQSSDISINNLCSE